MKKTKLVLPMLAGILAVSVYVANAKQDTSNKGDRASTEQDWLLTDPSNPNLPQSYTPVSDIETECQGTQKLCGIKAPANAQGEPIIGTNLLNEIATGQPTEHVFYMPGN